VIPADRDRWFWLHLTDVTGAEAQTCALVIAKVGLRLWLTRPAQYIVFIQYFPKVNAIGL